MPEVLSAGAELRARRAPVTRLPQSVHRPATQRWEEAAPGSPDRRLARRVAAGFPEDPKSQNPAGARDHRQAPRRPSAACFQASRRPHRTAETRLLEVRAQQFPSAGREHPRQGTRIRGSHHRWSPVTEDRRRSARHCSADRVGCSVGSGRRRRPGRSLSWPGAPVPVCRRRSSSSGRPRLRTAVALPEGRGSGCWSGRSGWCLRRSPSPSRTGCSPFRARSPSR